MASEKKSSNSRSRSTSNERGPLSAASKKTARTSLDASQTATPEHHFVICVRNDDYPASLELRKLYRVLEDSFAAEHGMVRVIDESGEDYLYPIDFFLEIDLPESIEKKLSMIA